MSVKILSEIGRIEAGLNGKKKILPEKFRLWTNKELNFIKGIAMSEKVSHFSFLKC